MKLIALGTGYACVLKYFPSPVLQFYLPRNLLAMDASSTALWWSQPYLEF